MDTAVTAPVCKCEFPMEMKTKIRYLIICCYLNLPYQNKMTMNFTTSYFDFDFDRKSTLRLSSSFFRLYSSANHTIIVLKLHGIELINYLYIVIKS